MTCNGVDGAASSGLYGSAQQHPAASWSTQVQRAVGARHEQTGACSYVCIRIPYRTATLCDTRCNVDLLPFGRQNTSREHIQHQGFGDWRLRRRGPPVSNGRRSPPVALTI